MKYHEQRWSEAPSRVGKVMLGESPVEREAEEMRSIWSGGMSEM